jgi:hypothetical protein
MTKIEFAALPRALGCRAICFARQAAESNDCQGFPILSRAKAFNSTDSVVEEQTIDIRRLMEQLVNGSFLES